jgi:hypothetical protein
MSVLLSELVEDVEVVAAAEVLALFCVLEFAVLVLLFVEVELVLAMPLT